MSTAVERPASEDRVGRSHSIRKLESLLAVILLMLCFTEGLSVWLRTRRQVTREIEQGVEQALTIRHQPRARQILFVGNSLIFEGVARSPLQQTMGERFVVHAAGIPGSTYDDWRYGLRSLLRQGSRPDVLAFGISPSQFLRPGSVTPLPVSRLWRWQEILAYYREQHPGLTILSELALEHASAFFAMRDTFRLYVRKAIPGYESMADGWTQSSSSSSSPINEANTVHSAFSARLLALQRECGRQAQIVLIIVPTNQIEDEALEPLLRSAADGLGIPVVRPIGEREWPRSKFQSDGYHLTASGAEEFSHLAAAQLVEIFDGGMRSATMSAK